MAIEFKSAPGVEKGGWEIFTLVHENGKLGLLILVGAVFAIYVLVLYLRSTPGFRVTDIKKTKRSTEEAVAVTRQRVESAASREQEAAE